MSRYTSSAFGVIQIYVFDVLTVAMYESIAEYAAVVNLVASVLLVVKDISPTRVKVSGRDNSIDNLSIIITIVRYTDADLSALLDVGAVYPFAVRYDTISASDSAIIDVTFASVIVPRLVPVLRYTSSAIQYAIMRQTS